MNIEYVQHTRVMNIIITIYTYTFLLCYYYAFKELIGVMYYMTGVMRDLMLLWYYRASTSILLLLLL